MYYACSDQDPQYSQVTTSQTEANYYKNNYGYTTEFRSITGCTNCHYIPENPYNVRSTAWNWIKNYDILT
jgi:hypothetical protein